MIKLPRYKRIFIIATILLFSLCVIIYAVEPGSAEDPIITLSYFTEKFEELKKELIKENEEINEPDLSDTIFKLINLKAGSILNCSEGTELIIRTGQMEAIASASGGLSDVTDGTNIDNGIIVPYNHHIISPRNDGRGLKVITGGAVMIKGKYSIAEPMN